MNETLKYPFCLLILYERNKRYDKSEGEDRKMKAINQQAKKVMDVLTENMDESEGENRSRRINNTDGTFMTVHVELLNKCSPGLIYSIAHYYEQNGDLMRDPDMEFIKGADGEYYPISFWQDAPLKREETIIWKDGEIVCYYGKRQAELVTFANMWLKNIKDQQKLGNNGAIKSKQNKWKQG